MTGNIAPNPQLGTAGQEAENDAPDLILGTAGHIDHGKSSLILALTGTDPDRLVEEKKRGITIELGFAQLDLPDGRHMGVVDVPGHERFVRQMIAGATGIDVALLTIAADDGVMPQTIEHVAVLQTLGVSACVVALTKIDLVDEDWIALMTEEVRAFLRTTPYAEAEIVPVSSRTGAGLDDLRAAIQRACAHISPIRSGTVLRLPIDRVFTIKGAGTVVTGTLWSGHAHADDTIELLPSGRTCRIRSVQIHGHDVDSAEAGNRVALNLNDIDVREVHAGDFAVTPKTVATTDRFDAFLTYLDTDGRGKALKTGQRMHIAHGTREVLGRILICNAVEKLLPGQSAYVQIRLEEPLPVSSGERFVIRTYSPLRVAGGGEVLIGHPRRRTMLSLDESSLLDALRAHDLQTAVETTLRIASVPLTARDISSNLGLDLDTVRPCLDAALDAKRVQTVGTGASGTLFSTPSTVRRMVDGIEHELMSYHTEHPDGTGISKGTLYQRCAPRCSAACFDALLAEAERAGKARVVNSEVFHPSIHGSALKTEEEAAQTLLGMLAEEGMSPSPIDELGARAHIAAPVMRKAMASLEREGKVVHVTDGLYLDAAAMETCRQAVARHLHEGGEGTVSALKTAMGISRKFALPVLEYLDTIGFTVRDGNTRVLKNP